MMTEDEAKTKWCPFARVMLFEPEPGAGNHAVNRTTMDCHCIGSACMAWRAEAGIVVPADSVTPEMLARKAGGYCGLAGRPS